MWNEETRMWNLALAAATGMAAMPAGMIDLATLLAAREASPQAEAAGEAGVVH